MDAVVQMEETYAVTEDAVRLKVKIVEGQKGRSVVLLDGEEIARARRIDVVVGHGMALRGKELVVLTVVSDVNRHTNRTRVEYTLRGGVEDHTYDQHFEVDDEGDIVDYEAIFNLVGEE